MHRAWLTYLVLCVASLLMSGCSLLIPGCDYSFTESCLVDPTLIILNENDIPVVPAQRVNGCLNVSISRTYSSESERMLIQKAEDLESTIGSTWYNLPWSTNVDDSDSFFLIPDAITTEALTYYAKRAQKLQSDSDPQSKRIYFVYSARLIEDPIGPPQFRQNESRGPIVRLELAYGESYSLVAGFGFNSWREVEFDQTGNVIEIRGDGDTILPPAV